MKVLFYNHTGQVSGAERVLLMILAGLDRDRFVSIVLCPKDGRLMNMASGLGVRTIPIQTLVARFSLRMNRLLEYLMSLFSVIRSARIVIKHEVPDIVHANSIRGGLVMSAAAVGLGIPIVWHAHDLLPRHPLSTAIRIFACVFRPKCIITVSRAVANRFQGVLLRLCRPRVPIKTIHNGVDVGRFFPDEQSRRKIRRELGIPKSQAAIAVVGQITPRKGHLELIHAFAEVARYIPEAILLIVGEPLFNRDAEYAKSLAPTASRLGVADRIRVLGSREDVPLLMRGLDLLVVNSSTEAFGLTIIEAMASGTAVLATAADGINEIVRQGESGWLVPVSDRRALVEAMLQLLRDEDLRKRLANRGRREVLERFTANRFLRDIEFLYQNLGARALAPSFEQAQSFKPGLSTD